MKTKKHYLILAVITGILCVPALGRIEFYPSAEESSHIVPNPALVGVKLIKVTIVPPDMELKKGISDWDELKGKIELKLEKAGINVFIPEEGIVYRLPVISGLKVRMEMFKFADSEEYVCRIRTSLSRAVNLPVKQSRTFRTDVWKTEPAMQAVSVKDMPGRVTEVVLKQVDAFIAAYLAANPQDIPPTDAKTSGAISLTIQKEQARPTAKPAVAKYKYVASKNSKVFHRPDCNWAKRIKPENLVGYSSRDEAIKAGKRPCKICKP